MKKVLSFLVAGALALGFSGCSGDLHDIKDPATIPNEIALASAPKLGNGGVAGAMQGWDVNSITWTTKDDVNCKYTYDFVATASEVEWKIVSEKGNWNSGAFGGGANEVTEANVDKTVALTFDNKTGVNKNVKTSGLKENKVYTISVEYKSGTYECTITASDKEKPVPFYLDGFFFKGNYGANSENDQVSNLIKGASVNEQTGEVEYKLEFACTESCKKEKYEFYIANSGTKYTGANLTVGEDYVELKKDDENKNSVNLTKGASYIVWVKTTAEKKVFAKITELPVYITLKVKITGLDKKLAGKTAVLGGSWNWDFGWTSAWGGSKKVSESMAGVVSKDGSVSLTYGEKLKYNKNEMLQPFQFCGYIGTEEDDDVKKAEFEIKFNGENIVADKAITTKEDAVWVINVDFAAETAEAKIEPPLAKVYVEGLPEDANGAVVYFTGNYFNDWKEPGEKETFEATVKDGKISLEGIDIGLSASGEKDIECKFAAKGWTRPEVTADEGENISVKMSATKTTLKGSYVSTKEHKEGGKQYVCEWTVE